MPTAVIGPFQYRPLRTRITSPSAASLDSSHSTARCGPCTSAGERNDLTGAESTRSRTSCAVLTRANCSKTLAACRRPEQHRRTGEAHCNSASERETAAQWLRGCVLVAPRVSCTWGLCRPSDTHISPGQSTCSSSQVGSVAHAGSGNCKLGRCGDRRLSDAAIERTSRCGTEHVAAAVASPVVVAVDESGDGPSGVGLGREALPAEQFVWRTTTNEPRHRRRPRTHRRER